MTFIFLENRNLKIPITDDSSTKIISKTIFAIYDTIEDFLITAKNQLITIGGRSLRMCRIPDESGKVRKKRMQRNLKIDFYMNRLKLNDEDDEAWEWFFFFHNAILCSDKYYFIDFNDLFLGNCSINNSFLIQDSKNRRLKSKRDVWLIRRKKTRFDFARSFIEFYSFSYLLYLDRKINQCRTTRYTGWFTFIRWVFI